MWEGWWSSMDTRAVVQDMVIGLASGYAGSKVMSAVTTKLMGLESSEDREREKRVSPGVSYNIAAQQIAGQAGIHLDEKQAEKVGSVFHLGLALTVGELYVLLRRAAGIGSIPAALVVSVTLFAGVDEILTPAMDWSAPDTAYPLATHLRGLAGHLALGAGVMVAGELLSRLMARS